jgi:hypothetical protein
MTHFFRNQKGKLENFTRGGSNSYFFPNEIYIYFFFFSFFKKRKKKKRKKDKKEKIKVLATLN